MVLKLQLDNLKMYLHTKYLVFSFSVQLKRYYTNRNTLADAHIHRLNSLLSHGWQGKMELRYSQT